MVAGTSSNFDIVQGLNADPSVLDPSLQAYHDVNSVDNLRQTRLLKSLSVLLRPSDSVLACTVQRLQLSVAPLSICCQLDPEARAGIMAAR
ncbi:hypothetical protein MRB53_041634 [Persea americana]|nr:hypothetical protein MRB53_041634 [Persea americana]